MPNPPTHPIQILYPTPGQSSLLHAVRAELARPGAPQAAVARYVPSYYDANRTHPERTSAFGVGPKGGRTRISPLLRAALKDAALTFGNKDGNDNENILLFLPGATLLLQEHGSYQTLTAFIADPDANPARGFHGMPAGTLPPDVVASLAARAPSADASTQSPNKTTYLLLRPNTTTWKTMTAHQRLEHHRTIRSNAAIAAWIDSLPDGGPIILERAGSIGLVSMTYDTYTWSGNTYRQPLHLFAL